MKQINSSFCVERDWHDLTEPKQVGEPFFHPDRELIVCHAFRNEDIQGRFHV